MYPTVVILLVKTQHSMTDVCESSPSSASKLGGPVASEARVVASGNLSFTVRPVHSMPGHEAKSQHSRTLRSQGGQEHGLEEVILEVKGSQVGTVVADGYHYNP